MKPTVFHPALSPEASVKTGVVAGMGKAQDEDIAGCIVEPLVGDVVAGSEDSRAEEEMDSGSPPVTTPHAVPPSVPSSSEEVGGAAAKHVTAAEEGLGGGEESEQVPVVKVIEDECQMDTLPSNALDTSDTAMGVLKDTQMHTEAGKGIPSEANKCMDGEKDHVSSVDSGETSDETSACFQQGLGIRVY